MPRNTPVPQPVPALELEALRLSLSNLHAAQLERTQATLQREKEAALTELRATLNGRHAQELALLQSRQQHEQALAREQHAQERQEMELRCRQETGAAVPAWPGARRPRLPMGRQAGDPASPIPSSLSACAAPCSGAGLCGPLARCLLLPWACVRF